MMKSIKRVVGLPAVPLAHVLPRPSRLWWSLCLLGVLLLLAQVYLASSALARPEALPCTYIIPKEVIKVDGQGNYSQIQPGDTLCLPAGTRGNIKFFNLHGTADQPITIQNTGGVARITGTRYSVGIGIIGSSNVRVTGTGVNSKCGAEYAPSEQECGIEVVQTLKGVVIFTKGTNIRDFEIDHLYIHDLSTQINSRAIGIHPEPGQTVSGFYVHHNYAYNTRGEGFYVGSEPHGKPLPEVGKLENVEVSYNLVEQTGYDGIKFKVAIQNVKVHHNIVRNAGVRGVLHHESGIQFATSTGQVYNNYVYAQHEGIATGRPLSNSNIHFFNNVVVGPRLAGMAIVDDNARVYNNTVVQSGDIGIKASGIGTEVFDNIIVGTGGLPTYGPAANFSNNFIGSIASAGFVNASSNDYRLLYNSPAVNAGRNSGLFPAFDYDDLSRPQQEKTDLGAFEYVLPGPSVTVEPPTSPETYPIFLPVIITD